MRYLLDTNVISQLLRNPHGSVQATLATHAESEIFTSVIVACELRYGARKRNSPQLTERVEQFLRSIEVAPLEADVDEQYANIQTTMELAGTPIGANDLLIAAHALAHQAVLVTDNVDEFARVPELVVENWVR